MRQPEQKLCASASSGESMQAACDLGETLLCCENVLYGSEDRLQLSDKVARAIYDPVMSSDARVLTNLLASERRYMTSFSYFNGVQNEILPHMRRILAYWMVEVCEESGCQDDVLPLAMNLLDRFLSVANVRKQQLQLTGAVCLFISSKLRESRPLTAQLLVQCTDNSVSLSDMLEWEMLILHKLEWEVSAVTAHDFLTPLLHRLPLHRYVSVARVPEVRRQAQTFVVMCATELQFMHFPASVVAAACLTAAVYGLLSSHKELILVELLRLMNNVVHADMDVLRECWARIEHMIRTFAAENSPTHQAEQQSSTSSPATDSNNNNTTNQNNNNKPASNNTALMTPQWHEVAG